MALETQIASCLDAVNRKKAPKPMFSQAFRWFWAHVVMKIVPGWESLAHVMKPATVVRWHRAGYRLYWRWKSKPGRPAVSRKMQTLIRKLSREDRLWDAERVREELLKLRYDPPCEDTVRKYMARPQKPRKPSGTWLPFLRNHLSVAWAMDFCTVTTIGFKTLYVFVVLEHGRRKVRHWSTTYCPTMGWIIQQLRNATPFGEQPRFMHRDNDRLYGEGVPAFLTKCGIEQVPIAYRCPWQNPYVERFFGTLRRELLDHVIPLSQDHLERLLDEFIEDYYHVERPHQGLGGETPIPCDRPDPIDGPAKLVSVPVLGGLHHIYRRVAA